MLKNKRDRLVLKKIAYIGPTPAYYFIPFLRELSKEPGVKLTVYWGCDETVHTYREKEFETEVTSQKDMLKGYQNVIVQNIIGKASYQKGFFGLNSIDFFKEFRRHNYDVVIIHGWQYLNNITALVAAKINGAKVFLRCEMPLNQEHHKTRLKKILKRIILPFFFSFIDKFLYIGIENKKFYEYYGARKNQLFFSPYSVNNDLFKSYLTKHKNSRKNLRMHYGISDSDIVFLFVGKLSHKKNPKILIQAINQLKSKKIKLILVGSGPLEKDLKKYVSDNKLSQIIFTDFQSQESIYKYYLMADVFVLPSGVGETWGLVINEALNFELPVIISDMVGSCKDLCTKNGMSFKYDNLDELCRCMNFLIKNPGRRKIMSLNSRNLIKLYSPKATSNGISKAIFS